MMLMLFTPLHSIDLDVVMPGDLVIRPLTLKINSPEVSQDASVYEIL